MEICLDLERTLVVFQSLIFFFGFILFFLKHNSKKGQLGAGNNEDYKKVKLIRNDKTIKAICTGKYHSFIYHRKKKKKKKINKK